MPERQPYPDEAHEHLARWVEDTVAALAVTRGDAEMSLALADLIFLFLDEAATERADLADLIEAHRIRIDAVNIRAETAESNYDLLQQQVADLTARVAALESPFVPTDPEEPV